MKGPRHMVPIRPSETQKWLRCPTLWQLTEVERWAPPPSAWRPEMLMGSAVHAGLAKWWHKREDPYRYELDEPQEWATLTLRQGWPADASEEHTCNEIELLVLKVLDATLSWISKNMAGAEPVLVEQPLGPDGHTTPDLVTREQGKLVVTDWKTHWNVREDRVRFKLEGTERAWQFKNYNWAVEEYLGEPVSLVRKVVIVGSPKIIIKESTYQPTREGQALWLAGARTAWSLMDLMRRGELAPWQNENACTQYGDRYPCPMWEACWTCHLDREKMKNFYTLREAGR